MKPLIIFFDGPCVMCNWWVNKLCQWDKNDQLRFTTLDHPRFLAFARARSLDLNLLDTSVVWDQEYSYALEAEGTFMILKRLGGLWSIPALLRFIPKGITNSIYRIVARNRYHWFGKHESCPLPDAKYAHKFLN